MPFIRVEPYGTISYAEFEEEIKPAWKAIMGAEVLEEKNHAKL